MEHAALSGNFGVGTTNMTLQQAVFAGLLDPGNIFIVREILSNPGPSDVDTALFSGASADYLVTANPNGSITITHTAALGGGGGGGGGGGVTRDDGTDTLWNIELLAFTDGTFSAPASACKTLALGHTGSGSDPTASPANSVGCAVGTYLPGESISLSGAAASTGFQIGSWTGTSNNASTAATNSFSMPAANHSVTVNYVDNAPVVSSISRLNVSPTALGTVNFIVVFSEPVTGVNAVDFSLNSTVAGAAITNMSGTGATRTVTVNTGTGSGTIRLDVADNDSILDSVSNPLGGAGAGNANFTGQAYTIDKVVPTVVSITRASSNPTGAASVNYLVTFSEPVYGVDAADFTFTLSGVTGAGVTSVAGSGATRTVTVNTGSGSGNLQLDLTDNNTIVDYAINPLGGAGAGNGNFAGQAYTVDKTVPTVVSVTRTSANPSKAVSVNYLVTFSEPVYGVDSGDFTFTLSGVTGATVTSVGGSGATRTVTVNTGSGNGTLQLDLTDNNTIVDYAINPLGGAGAGNGNFAGQAYIVDKTVPTVVSITRTSANPSKAGSVNYLVTFSEPVYGVDASDFTFTLSGVTGATVTSVGGSGATRTVTVNMGSGDGTLQLDLTDNNTIVDYTLNPLGGVGAGNGNFTGQAYTVDKTVPTVASIIAISANPTTSGTNVSYAVIFSEPVYGVDAADFTFTLSGVTGATITSISGGGATRTVVVNTGTGSGTLRLDLTDNNTIVDYAINPLGGAGAGNGNFTGQTYSMIAR